MREYTVAAKERTVEFTGFVLIDPKTKKRREIKMRIPDETDFATTMADVTGRGRGEMDELGATVNFFFDLIVDKKDADYLWKRLKNFQDDFDMDSISGIYEDLIEEWSGRPTQSASGSTEQPQGAGLTSSVATPTSI